METVANNIHNIDICNLREAKDNKRLVVFVGAGASIASGYPSWCEVVEKIAKNLPYDTKGLDLLRIPQYYYNERGRNEYEKFMRKIFRHQEILPIHEIHKEIIKLGTSIIVTTNYDNLIERAFEEYGVFLNVIAEDKDIPYKNIGHTLIKMHGDFEHHNFVLKEDDYLHYGQNFKIIETFLKSLIATNTLLFIGYSFNDPDTKQIFSWIKEILGENMLRAYMLNVTDDYNELHQKYYRNLGINVIYAKEIHKSISDLSILAEHTLKLINISQNNSVIDKIYNYLKPLGEFNYVYKDYIEKAFQRCGFKLDDNRLVLDNNGISQDDDIFDLLKNEEEIKRNARLNYVNGILKKSFVKEISTPEKLESKNDKISFNFYSRSISEYQQSSLANYLIDFDYKHIEELANASISKDTKITRNELIYKAFLYYKLEKYPRSYELLKQSATTSLRNRDFVSYFLSEFNCVTLGRIICNSWLYKSELQESVRNDLKEIDLNQIFRNLPNLGNDNNEFLRDLYTSQIVYRIFHKSYNTSLEVNKDRETLYLCYNQIPKYEMLYEIVKDFWLYEVENYIIYRYSEVKSLYNFYISTLIESISVPEKKKEDPLFKCISTNVKATTFKIFDIFLIIEYADLKELRQIFKKFKVPTNSFDTECIEYLIKIIPNILKQNAEYLEKAIFLTQYVQMNSRLLMILLKVLQQCLSNEKLVVYVCNIFAKIKEETDIWDENKEEIRKLLLRLIQYVLESLVKTENKCNQNHCALLEWGLYFYENRYGLFNDAAFDDFIFHATDVDKKLELIKCYQYVDENKKKKIRSLFVRWKYSLDVDIYTTVSIYAGLVSNKIKKTNLDFENRIIKKLPQIKEDNKDRYPNLHGEVLHVLISMCLSGNFALVNELNKYVKSAGEPFHKWIMDISNFNYANFELKWLTKICDEKILQKISVDSTASKRIIEIFKKEANREKLDEKLTEIYFKYFCA